MRRTVLLLLVGLVWLGAVAAPAFARSSDVVAADVQLELARDASLLVTERLTFDYEGSFEGSYRDIELVHGERITDVRLSEAGREYERGGNTILGSHDRPGVYGVETFGGQTRVVWHYRATDERRTFELSYRVHGAAVAYDDVIDVGWAVWGDQWDFDLARLTARLRDPALDPDNPDYRVWGHPLEVEGETHRGDGVATLAASDVPDGTGVEIRVTVPLQPNRLVSGTRPGTGDGLPQILAEEQGLEDDYNSFFNRAKRWIAAHALLLSLLLAGLAVAILAMLTWRAREHRTSAPEYLPEPPDDASPALAYGLAHESDHSHDTVLATLLDLVDRGYYETSSANTQEEKLDLALRRSEQRPAAPPLEPHEQAVLEFFDQLLDSNTVAISELKNRIPQHSGLWRGRWERMTEKLDNADAGQLGWDRDFNRLRWILVPVLALAFAAVTLIDLSVDEEFIAPAAVGLVALAVLALWPRNRLRRVDLAYRERTAAWQAFAAWTKDFPRLSDDPPATLALWQRILVYGVAFGTAERMIKSGRIPAPVAEAAGTSGMWTSYAFSGSLADSSFDGSSFSSGFSSQVAPESSSSGGGGGFSGGGGGFSGGGGGGSW